MATSEWKGRISVSINFKGRTYVDVKIKGCSREGSQAVNLKCKQL